MLSGLAQSKESNSSMVKAAESLSLLVRGGGKSAPPTKDHLAPEDGPPPEQPPPSQSVNGKGPKAGSFEKLNAMFGGAGTMFTLPSSARQ